MESKCISIVCIGMLLTLTIGLRKVNGEPVPQRTDVEDFTIERFDRDYYVSVPLSDYRLSRLRRGYYYIDDGFITSIPPYAYNPLDGFGGSVNRRLDDGVSDSARRANYQPLIKYKQTKAKRKKLFVPNFFG